MQRERKYPHSCDQHYFLVTFKAFFSFIYQCNFPFYVFGNWKALHHFLAFCSTSVNPFFNRFKTSVHLVIYSKKILHTRVRKRSGLFQGNFWQPRCEDFFSDFILFEAKCTRNLKYVYYSQLKHQTFVARNIFVYIYTILCTATPVEF